MPHPARIAAALVLTAMLVLCACVAAAAPAAMTVARPTNCGFAAPPPQAGVDGHLGALLRVYPRNPDIGPAYTGCQTLWAQADDGWEVITVAHYARGHVVRVDSPAQPGDPIEACVVENGIVRRGDLGLCAQLDDMRFESLPPACVDDAAPRPGARCIRE
jgi:hypothetical protein